ncbi:probable E3 ubiquitin-protein ligase ZFP1 isoform X2 [Arachis duranensis]|nr:probable E3 ubiquitin-protein ligase ZFP1 isoform X2 [Arachis duranensis]
MDGRNFRAIDSHYVFDSSEVRFRHAGPVPHTGRQMYRRNRRGLSRTTLGRGNFPAIELVQVDGVAVLVNHYIDTELRVEDMSYEGLNALGQQIGHVSTGLSEEIITNQMKTKTYLMAASAVNLEEATSQEVEADVCIICQDEYKNQDMIGVLQCEHEYHADCLRKWLLVRNVCPLCKSEAFILGV